MFTLHYYENLLLTLQDAKYEFVTPTVDIKVGDTNVCFLRHDIDVSLDRAIALSKIEVKHGIKTTYCIRLRSGLYNALGKKEDELIRTLIADGHDVGLHFDRSVYPRNMSIIQVASACDKECLVIENWFGFYCKFVSFHKPTTLEMSGSPEISGGRQHSFMGLFTETMTYFADSYGFWRFGHPIKSKAFDERKPLHINIHPEWWVDDPKSSVFKLHELAEERQKQLRSELMWDIVGV